MLDAMSMDQLRTFIAAADEGSFSAAGRKLRRAQSVVSTTLANLEQQVGFALFDRGGRYPQLTEAGRALLEQARQAAAGMDAFKAKARTLAEGLEPELAVAVDVMFPIATLTAAVQAFQLAFPSTPLRLYVEALGAVPTGGHFFGEAHTLERYATAFYQPMLSNWQNYEAWQEAGGLDATARATRLWKKALEDYVEPVMDIGVREALEAYVARRKEAIGQGEP